MNLDLLRLVRNILLRTAAIAYSFILVSSLVTITFWDTWTGLNSQWFHISPETLGLLVANFLACAKFYAIFLVLSPALALHWTIKASEKKA